MIRFTAKPEPADFDKTVRAPGKNALMELRGDPAAPKRRGPKRRPVIEIRGSDLPDFWTRCLPDLRAAFDEVCAYACVWIDPATTFGTVDHFEHKDAHPDQAYEWSNFRYASQTMNLRKHTDPGICDPFAVNNGDFVLDLVTFGVDPHPNLHGAARNAIKHTIERLELDSATMRKRREQSWELFATNPNKAGWEMLEADCPFVAREYVRQRGLPPEASVPGPQRFTFP